MNNSLHYEFIELTKELIRIQSTSSRPQELSRCADFIAHWLDRNHIRYTRMEFNSIPSICIMPGDTLRAPLLLNAHFDVVESDNTTLFEPDISNGKLYGRGAIDDKYGVALSLILFREKLKQLRSVGKKQSDMMFGVILTGDEETGGHNGMARIAELAEADFFIVLDGGKPDLIVTKEKGILLLELTATGTAAHAARPWLGESGFDILVEDYTKLRTIFTDSPDGHWHKTMVLSRCQAGNGSSNVVPQTAKATLDIRYTEEDNPHEIIAAIRSLVRSNVEITALEPVFCTGKTHYLDVLKTVVDKAYFASEHGASDARYFSKKKIPGVIWGADGEMSQHTDNEYLLLDSIQPFYTRLNQFIQYFIRDKKRSKEPHFSYSALKN